ncbi:SIR2 family protein [Rhizobium binxianense]
MAAGYPSWASLLREVGEELGLSSSDIHDLAALAQWHIRENGGATRVRNIIKTEIGRDLPVPEALEVIARLPVRHIWTTNYDRLVERAFEAIRRPIDVLSGSKDLSLKAKPSAVRLYKMHGSIDRLDDIVISTDDYELYRSRRGAFLPLLQAHLTGMSMLFVGLSLTDPNVRHVLSLIRESFLDAPPEHFAIVRPPKADDFTNPNEFKARAAQHALWAKDLQRYGLIAVEIDDYDEVPALLRQVERRVANQRVWVSGSWPIEAIDPQSQKIYRLSENLGRLVGNRGLCLVTGSGVLVGPASIAGFLEALRVDGGWDIDQRLISRPFPQPPLGGEADKTLWSAHRAELARNAGTVVFLGGAKTSGGSIVAAEGVMEEFEKAKGAGAFLLPVGSTGGAAKLICDQLQGSSLPFSGSDASRPSDDELTALSDETMTMEATIKLIDTIIMRHHK